MVPSSSPVGGGGEKERGKGEIRLGHLVMLWERRKTNQIQPTFWRKLFGNESILSIHLLPWTNNIIKKEYENKKRNMRKGKRRVKGKIQRPLLPSEQRKSCIPNATTIDLEGEK